MIEVRATFEELTDLIWRLQSLASGSTTKYRIVSSGLIAPAIEVMMMLQKEEHLAPHLYFEIPAAPAIRRAVAEQKIFGLNEKGRVGAFPLELLKPDGYKTASYIHWLKSLENKIVLFGFDRNFAQGIIGSLHELANNIFEHSGKCDGSIIIYGVGRSSIEFIVSDVGQGIYASLMKNPANSHIRPADSLREACRDLVSGNTAPGRGLGFGRLFRSLARVEAFVRLRSGSRFLELNGNSVSLNGNLKQVDAPRHPGVTVSFRIEAPSATRLSI